MAKTLPSENSHNCDETIKGLHTTIEGLMPSLKPIYHHQQSEASGTLGAHVASSKQPQSSLIDHQPQSSLIDHQIQSSSTDCQLQSSSIDHQTQSSSNNRQPLKRVVKGGGGGVTIPFPTRNFFQNPSPSWIFIKNPSEKIGIYRLKKSSLNHHMWLCVLHIAEVVSYFHGYLT